MPAAQPSKMPSLGPNPLQEALENYQMMAQRLQMAEDELTQHRGIEQDLMRENDGLRRDLEKAKAERDKYQAVAINLSTRAVQLRETVESLILEAMRAGAAARPAEMQDGTGAYPAMDGGSVQVVRVPAGGGASLLPERAAGGARLPANQFPS